MDEISAAIIWVVMEQPHVCYTPAMIAADISSMESYTCFSNFDKTLKNSQSIANVLQEKIQNI